MKRIITSLLVLAMLTSLSACSAPAAETKASEAPAQTEAATPSPTTEATPTPEPTMSPEEIALLEKYELLLNLWNTYSDESALVLLSDMAFRGDISENDIAFQSTVGAIDGDYYLSQADYEFNERYDELFYTPYMIMNGRCESTDEKSFGDIIWQHTFQANDVGNVYVGIFDSKEKMLRVSVALDAINEFCNDPSDMNREIMEEAYFSEELTPGEIVVVFAWLWGKPDGLNVGLTELEINEKTIDSMSYIESINEKYGTSIVQRRDNAVEELFDLNNLPSSEKDLVEPFEVPQAYSEEELTELLSLNEAKQLEFFWKHYGDEYAALLLKKIYEEGTLEIDQFNSDYIDFANQCSSYKADKYSNAADMVNGEKELSIPEKNIARLSLDAFFRDGSIPISLFTSEEKRERMLRGINLINIWLKEPNNENTSNFEKLMLSETLSTGEFIFLYKYVQYYMNPLGILNNTFDCHYSISAEGKKYGTTSYFDERQLESGITLKEMYMQFIGAEKVEDDYGYWYDIPGLFD